MLQPPENGETLTSHQWSISVVYHVIAKRTLIVYHVFALNGKPLAKHAQSLLWFWSLLLISARADVNDLFVGVGCSECACSSVVLCVCMFGFNIFPPVAVDSRLSSRGRVLLLFLFPRNMFDALLF